MPASSPDSRRKILATPLSVVTAMLIIVFCAVGLRSFNTARADVFARSTADAAATESTSRDATATAAAFATEVDRATATAEADQRTTTVEVVLAGEGHVIDVTVNRDGSFWGTAAGEFCVNTLTGPRPAPRCAGFSNGRFSLFVGDHWVGRASVTFTFDGDERTFYTDYRGEAFGWEPATIEVV